MPWPALLLGFLAACASLLLWEAGAAGHTCFDAPKPWEPFPSEARGAVAYESSGRRGSRVPRGPHEAHEPQGRGGPRVRWGQEGPAWGAGGERGAAGGGGRYGGEQGEGRRPGAGIRYGRESRVAARRDYGGGYSPRGVSRGGRGMWGGGRDVGRGAALSRRRGQAGARALLQTTRQRGSPGSANPSALNFNPLMRFCLQDKQVRARKGQDLSAGEVALSECLRRPRSKCHADPGEIKEAIDGLMGMRLLNRPPPCMVVHSGSTDPECSTTKGNKETGPERWTNRMRAKLKNFPGGGKATYPPPRADLRRGAFSSCALVGNAPHIKHAPNGQHIDRFEAVIRFNHILKVDPTRGHRLHMGTKTTFRMFSRSASFDLAEGKMHIVPGRNERGWMFWHDKSQHAFEAIRRRGGEVPLMMLSPAMINWQLEVYFTLRKDMRRLGLGPFGCPRNVNSGMHMLLLTQHLCGKVGLFGISHTSALATRPGAHLGDPSHIASRFHDWDFDTLVVRLLHLSNRLSVCTV